MKLCVLVRSSTDLTNLQKYLPHHNILLFSKQVTDSFIYLRIYMSHKGEWNFLRSLDEPQGTFVSVEELQKIDLLVSVGLSLDHAVKQVTGDHIGD